LGGEKLIQTSFICPHSPKKFLLTFDGGILGDYILEICMECSDKEDKRFLKKEEIIK